MRAGIVAASIAFAVMLSGCDPNDRVYFRDGIGTQLYTADTASATELQNVYLDYICRQSISSIGADAPGCAQIVPANAWPVIVQAGLNDIDARCDSYLAWLDAKRRENAVVLTEIGAVRFAVDALTNPGVTGVSAVGLAAISAAFGLANDTVKNFNSLLLQVDHTTVQSVVVTNRDIFRKDLQRLSLMIDNKPAAIHTLRSYLSICMPMTISANINSTVTVFKQTGIALGAGPVIPTLGVSAPLTARQEVHKQVRPIKFTEAHRNIIADFDQNVHSTGFVQNILKRLCAPASEVSEVNSKTNARIMAYQQALHDSGDPTVRITGKLTTRELGLLGDKPICSTEKFKNLYEEENFPKGIADPDLVAAMNKKLPPDHQLAADATATQIRIQIPDLRTKLDKQLKLKGSQVTKDLSDQLTSDLVNALFAQ